MLTVYIENIINTATISGIAILHPPTAGMEGIEIKKFIRVGMNKSIRLGWNKICPSELKHVTFM